MYFECISNSQKKLPNSHHETPDDVKRAAKETYEWPLKYPELFSELEQSGKAFAGMLLYGPPGCGKTMAASAIAGEYKVSGGERMMEKREKEEIDYLFHIFFILFTIISLNISRKSSILFQ